MSALSAAHQTLTTNFDTSTSEDEPPVKSKTSSNGQAAAFHAPLTLQNITGHAQVVETYASITVDENNAIKTDVSATQCTDRSSGILDPQSKAILHGNNSTGNNQPRTNSHDKERVFHLINEKKSVKCFTGEGHTLKKTPQSSASNPPSVQCSYNTSPAQSPQKNILSINEIREQRLKRFATK